MAESSTDKVGEGRLDLVPMIDCIMLLLLFFILTSRFTEPDRAVHALLSTRDGELSASSSTPVPPPQQIVLAIAPAGMAPGQRPAEYLLQLRAFEQQLPPGGVLERVELHLGGDEPLAIDGQALRGPSSPEQLRLMTAIHGYVFAALARRERPGVAARREQDPVMIRCFSQLPWKFTMAAYDAVRAYESFMSPQAQTRSAPEPGDDDPRQWGDSRRIDFSPPPIRNYSAHALGDELYGIVNQR